MKLSRLALKRLMRSRRACRSSQKIQDVLGSDTHVSVGSSLVETPKVSASASGLNDVVCDTLDPQSSGISIAKIKKRTCGYRNKMHLTRTRLKEGSVVCTPGPTSKLKIVVNRPNQISHRYEQDPDRSDKFPCKECGKHFASLESARRHVAKFHSKHTAIYNCALCSKWFDRSYRLRIHMEKKHPNHSYQGPQYQCQTCQVFFDSKLQRDSHVLRNHSGLDHVFDCDTCEACFNSRRKLRMHAKTHAAKYTLPGPLKCNDCGETFDRSTLLKRHTCVLTGQGTGAKVPGGEPTHKKKRPYVCLEKLSTHFPPTCSESVGTSSSVRETKQYNDISANKDSEAPALQIGQVYSYQDEKGPLWNLQDMQCNASKMKVLQSSAIEVDNHITDSLVNNSTRPVMIDQAIQTFMEIGLYVPKETMEISTQTGPCLCVHDCGICFPENKDKLHQVGRQPTDTGKNFHRKSSTSFDGSGLENENCIDSSAVLDSVTGSAIAHTSMDVKCSDQAGFGDDDRSGYSESDHEGGTFNDDGEEYYGIDATRICPTNEFVFSTHRSVKTKRSIHHHSNLSAGSRDSNNSQEVITTRLFDKENNKVHDLGLLPGNCLDIKDEVNEKEGRYYVVDGAGGDGTDKDEANDDILLHPLLCDFCGASFFSRCLYTEHVATHNIVVKCNICTDDAKRNHEVVIENGLQVKFTCKVCLADFCSEESQDNHVKPGTENKSCVCEMCHQTLETWCQYKTHMQHPGCRPIFPCGICGKIFDKRRNITRHKHIHLKPKPCKKKNTTPPPVCCFICGKSFTRLSHVYRHNEQMHAGMSAFHCEKCQETFTSKVLLLEHKAEHGPSRPFVCDVCGRSYTAVQHLRNHAKEHTGTTPQVICDICGKVFKNASKMRAHRERHLVSRPHECDVCSRCFVTAEQLKHHGAIHHGTRPYVCVVCNKGFINQAQLKEHSVIHGEEKPFGCNICNKRFKWSSALRYHLKNHAGDRPHVCEFCGKAFIKPSFLTKHLSDKHAQEECA